MATDQERPHKKVKGISPGEADFLPDWTGSGGKKVEDGRPLHTEVVHKKSKPRRKADPKARKKGKYRQPPKDIRAYAKKAHGEGKSLDALKGLYRFSEYRSLSEDAYSSGTSTRRTRVFCYGQEFLAGKAKVTRRNIRKWLKRFEEDGIILKVYQGYKGRGSTIYKLAYNEGHRVKNKGITTRRKKPPTR